MTFAELSDIYLVFLLNMVLSLVYAKLLRSFQFSEYRVFCLTDPFSLSSC